MKARVLPALAALSLFAACSMPDAPTSPSAAPSVSPSFSQNPNDEIQNDPKVRVHLARGVAGSNKASVTASPLLLFHGGEILTETKVQAIFWGPSWANSVYVGDKISGLDGFYGGIGNSTYMQTNTEYGGTNGNVSAKVDYAGHVTDFSAVPNGAPKTSDILAEVCKAIPNPVANAYYPVYTDSPRGSAKYCAWHSYGSCNGVQVEFGFFFSLDNDPGCDPRDVSTSHSQGLSALANVSGHELSETATDPSFAGWYDANGAENSDKCAWTFNGTTQFQGGISWLIQGNWSNEAYKRGSGYARGGCISGK